VRGIVIPASIARLNDALCDGKSLTRFIAALSLDAASNGVTAQRERK
jgi:hypothetical protein